MSQEKKTIAPPERDKDKDCLAYAARLGQKVFM